MTGVQTCALPISELKIAYGGGSFGSGYEVKIPLAKPEDALVVLEKLRKAAMACR